MSDFLDLNRFKKQAKIGEGAFGEVYKVKEDENETIFAAKVSLSELNEDDSSIFTDLKGEVSILSQLNHPSVLKFIGYSPINFDQESYPTIISEYSPKGSLNDIIKLERNFKAPPQWTDTKKLINIYGIASAMSYLHSHNIIHRDLKPDNILEDENLFPKIADFGLSKLNIMSTQTKEGLKGTPIYMAPEIYLDNEYSKAGDVYAFSFIVYEILTLEEPFKNINFFTLYSKVIVNKERPEFNFPLPNCYIDLITRCWSHEAKERPTFQEIVEEIRKNKEFIIDTIDYNEFYDYVDFIDSTGISFESNKKLKSIISNQEKNDEEIMTVETFNKLSIEKQRTTILNMIENNDEIENKDILYNINELLEYFERFEPKNEEIKYFTFFEGEEVESIELICQQTSKITISYKAIELIYNKSTKELNEFKEYISKFEIININIKYPTTSFSDIYEEALKLKETYKDQIFISIFISGLDSTDMKFRYDENIHSVTIDNNVQKIAGEQVLISRYYTFSSGGGSFCNCTSLTQITIPSSVTEIGIGSFYGCSSLIQITIPSSVTKICETAFFQCSSLAEVKIGSSVTEIGDCAFYGCKSLTQIVIPSSVKVISKLAFYGCSSLTNISIPSSVINIEKNAFGECSLLRRISIPSSITEIKKLTFNSCSSLRQVILPSSLTIIGKRAFKECSSLTQITIPSSVISIKEAAFSRCTSLEEITIPSSVAEISYYAFEYCSSLAQVTITSSKTEIEYEAFINCSSLKQIIIPSFKIDISYDAFKNCSSFTQAIISPSSTENDTNSFTECSTPAKENLKYVEEIHYESYDDDYNYYEEEEEENDDDKLNDSQINKVNESDSNCDNDDDDEEEEENDDKLSDSQINKINESDSNYDNDKQNLIDEFIIMKDSKGLMNYLHNNCNEEEILYAFDLCFSSSQKLYLELCKEGILLNNAIAHHKYALFLISNDLESETERKENYKKVKFHLEESIKQGFILSYFTYARIHYEIFKNYNEAFLSAKEGANRGEKYSKCLLGYFIAHGIGTKKYFNQGVEMMLESKADDFYEIFATDFGLYYSKIKGKQNKTFYWFEKAFNMKKTKATINNYGICFIKGIGVSKNIKKAKKIFEIGLNLNDTNSMYHLGFILEENDQEISNSMYKKAAEQGNVYAQIKYGSILLKSNPEKSLEYFKSAADQNNIESQENLGNFLADKNPNESLKYYKKALDAGSIKAKESLVKKYSDENDTENTYLYIHSLIKKGNFSVPLEYALKLYKAEKYDLAFEYFSIISEFNNPIAKYFIGVMNFYGQGCIQNKQKSYEIMKSLSENNIDKATEFIENNFT